MEVMLKSVQSKRISEQVFEQIKDLIDNGDLKPGCKLMPERELAESLEVSRTAVREAIQRLASLGLVAQYQGRGTFILDHDSDCNDFLSSMINFNDVSLKDFLEIRQGYECHAAGLAAGRACEFDIIAMQNSIDKMAVEECNGRFNIDADISFHKAIAAAAKNPLHTVIGNIFTYRMEDSIRKNIKQLNETPGAISLMLEHHKAIFEHIKRRETTQAFDAMKQHLTIVLQLLSPHLG